MKAKKTLLPVEWTDVVIEEVPVISPTALDVLAVQRFLRFVRNRPSRVTRSAANGPRRMVQVLSSVS
ncbi:MAG TPA: hypothetical protein VG938_12580 [Verrucomicrobiae bacterium]|jgi:hypothetical protein|nr:hypothetical protein [Verrucomicrobiae bacterium]